MTWGEGLFYCDSLRRHTEGERRYVVDSRDNEIALRDDIHTDEHIVVEFAVVIAVQHAEIGDFVTILPTAEVLLQYAHRGRTLDVITRCVLGVCGTGRVEMNRAT